LLIILAVVLALSFVGEAVVEQRRFTGGGSERTTPPLNRINWNTVRALVAGKPSGHLKFGTKGVTVSDDGGTPYATAKDGSGFYKSAHFAGVENELKQGGDGARVLFSPWGVFYARVRQTLPPDDDPEWLGEAARTALDIWNEWTTEKTLASGMAALQTAGFDVHFWPSALGRHSLVIPLADKA
jgi:hypothetical protein